MIIMFSDSVNEIWFVILRNNSVRAIGHKFLPYNISSPLRWLILFAQELAFYSRVRYKSSYVNKHALRDSASAL